MQSVSMSIQLFVVMKPLTSWPSLRVRKRKLLNCKYHLLSLSLSSSFAHLSLSLFCFSFSFFSLSLKFNYHQLFNELIMYSINCIYRTRSAMRGGLNFRDALAKRLDLIKPSQQLISDYLKLHPPRFTPGIKYVFLSASISLLIS